ncbi:MAG TPA: hypothetical protein VF235_04090 [Actinomycetota bacterium]
MTERWRKRLEDLDKAWPSDEVFHRAAEGPQLPEESIPYPSNGSRVVGGVAAFVVFALAISVFVVPALRMNQTAGAPGEALLPLWPAQTLDKVEEFQADADAAGDWYELVDPSRTASRFVIDVMGWESDRVRVDEIGGFVYPTVAPTNAYFGPTTYTGSSTMSPSSPFRMFHVAWVCAPNERCPMRGPVTVTVFQPLERGDGKVWMVLEVQSDLIDLTVSGGMVLTDGDEIAAGFQRPSEAETLFGYHAGGDNECTVTVESEEFAVVGDQNKLLLEPSGSGLVVDLSAARESPGCVSPQPGYVFAAMAYEPLGGDPLEGGDVSLIGLSAVPLAFAWDEEPPPPTVGPIPTPTASASVGPAEVVWTTYTDPLGWTIDVPAGWQQTEFTTKDGTVSSSGAAFAPQDTPIPDGAPTAPSLPGQMIVYVFHASGGPYRQPENDSSLPLACDLLTQVAAAQGTEFRGDGLPFSFTYAVGDDRPTDEQRDIACHMIESIRFEPWQDGETRNGYTLVREGGPVTDARIHWIEMDGGDWAFISTDGSLQRFLNGYVTPPCEGAEFLHETEGYEGSPPTGVAAVRCPNGSVARWDMNGVAFPENPLGLDVDLERFTAIRSWEGLLLVDFAR